MMFQPTVLHTLDIVITNVTLFFAAGIHSGMDFAEKDRRRYPTPPPPLASTESPVYAAVSRPKALNRTVYIDKVCVLFLPTLGKL